MASLLAYERHFQHSRGLGPARDESLAGRIHLWHPLSPKNLDEYEVLRNDIGSARVDEDGMGP